MASVAEVPKESFRLSQLIYDTRYRSITIQVIVLLLVLLFVGWLADNTIKNLAAKDKDINFGFLWSRAGYDIGQQLIPYTNDSSHGRAALVGLIERHAAGWPEFSADYDAAAVATARAAAHTRALALGAPA